MQQEIDSLTAELDHKTRLYAKRPKRKVPIVRGTLGLPNDIAIALRQ